MTSSIEDRLGAALEARAEQVTPETLGALTAPGARRHGPPRGVLLAVAAATVVAAAVTVPFVVGDDDAAVDPGTSTPSVTTSEPTDSPSPDQTNDFDPDEPFDADLDGDGAVDVVNVVLPEDADGYATEGVVQVILVGGGGGYAEVPEGYTTVLRPFSLNSDGKEQVLLQHTGGGDSASLLVYTWTDGKLVQAQVDGDAPLALELDGSGRVADYYFSEGPALISWARQEPPSDGPLSQVNQWLWRLNGDRLVPEPIRDGCVDVTSDDTPDDLLDEVC